MNLDDVKAFKHLYTIQTSVEIQLHGKQIKMQTAGGDLLLFVS